jgi:ATP-dependent Clp protease adaptor protein ClpS
VGLWEKPRVRYAEEVTAAIARASAEATRRRHREVTTAHLLWALFACPSVEGCLTTMGVEPAAARQALASELDDLPRASWMTFRRPQRNFDALLVVALRLESATAGRTLSAPLLTGRLLSGSAGEARCAGLAKAGFTRTEFLRVVAHGDIAPPPAPADGLVTVVLVDDPFTTMEHVVGTLREVFGITTDAEKLMMRVHRTGRGVVATMDASAAQEKISAVHARAAAAGMPLRAVAAAAAAAERVASAPVGVSSVE